MLEELNALAQKLAVFDRVDSIAFEGLVKMAEQKPEPFGVKELINFAHSTESCHVVSDVFDDEQLGRFYAGNGFICNTLSGDMGPPVGDGNTHSLLPVFLLCCIRTSIASADSGSVR